MTDKPDYAALAERLAQRFLMWTLLQTVCADQCATDPNYGYPRSGTNLLGADEARQMIEHLLDESELADALRAGVSLDDEGALLEALSREIAPAAWHDDLPVPTRSDTIEFYESRAKANVVARRLLPLIQSQVAKAVAAERERAALECEAQAKVFGSNEYAIGQPLSSVGERFACATCAAAIRNPDTTNEG